MLRIDFFIFLPKILCVYHKILLYLQRFFSGIGYMPLNSRLSVQRIESFIDKCDEYRRECLRKGLHLSDIEIFTHVTRMPAPRFYVDTYFCAVQLKRISRGLKPKIISPVKRKMYYDIYNLYCKKIGGRIVGNIDFSILEDVIISQAPQYYIMPSTAKQLINLYYRNRHKRK